MSKSHIAICCNGSLTLGMGHIMRTLVLAEELKKDYQVSYICKGDSEYALGTKEIQERGYAVFYEDDDVEANLLILDSYDIEEDTLSQLRKKYGKLMYIDDLNDLKFYDCDILLNRNLKAEAMRYETPKECKVLLGMRYMLLRKEFRVCNPPEVKREVKDILVTMGGTDPKNTSVKVLDILKGVPFHFHVVVGKGFADHTIEQLEKIAHSHKNIILHYDPDMVTLMCQCDIAISACGGTVYELSALGIPHIAISVALNQEIESDNSHHKKVAFGINKPDTFMASVEELYLYAGNEKEIKPMEFLNIFNYFIEDVTLREQLSDNQKRLVNRDGVVLIVKEIKQAMKELEIKKE